MRRVLLALAASALVFGCASKPPPPPPPPPPKVEPPPPPPPPPPPKCEALDEGCKAKKDTLARIANTSLAMTPPEGWIYAQTGSALIVELAAGGPALDVTGREIDPKKPETGRDDAVTNVLGYVDVVAPKGKKINWKKPDDTKQVGSLKLSLYGVAGATRGGKAGELLVFVAPLDAQSELLGIAFVNEDDQTKADEAMLNALATITAAPPPKDPLKTP